MKCCLCDEEIAPVGDWTMGNDAWPAADGRCCNPCDMSVVVPARLAEMRKRDPVVAAIPGGDPSLTMKKGE